MPSKEQSVSLLANTFKGFVLNPSEISVDFNSARLCSNVIKNKQSQLTIRKGIRSTFNQIETQPYQALFPYGYVYNDTDNGTTVEELVGLSMSMDSSYVQQTVKLYRFIERTLTITYIGPGEGNITITPEAVSGDYNVNRVIAKSNGITVYESVYETINDPSSTGNINTFFVDIAALPDYSCSPFTAQASVQGCFIDVFGGGIDLVFAESGSTQELTYYDIELVGTLADAPKTFTDADFINPSFQNFNNVLDIAYGNYPYKYDGRDVYRMGLPQASIFSIADAAGGSTFTLGDTFIYKAVFTRVDNRGNIIEGEDSDDSLAVASHTMVANKDITLNLNSLVASAYPNFALRGAKINGAQVGVNTITVDSGHTLLVGDDVYLYNGTEYVVREVTAIAATTITIDGAVVTVADDALISNNVRAQIWRTKANGTDFYFIAEVPVNTLTNSLVYTDSTPDSSLTEPYVEQIRKFSLPPKCHFIGEHQGLRLVAGDPDNPNKLSWALPDSPEAFPAESNNTNINAGGIGAITAFITVDDDGLVVFKPDGHVILDGSLDDLVFRTLNRSTTGIGCSSFSTLKRIGEKDSPMGLCKLGVFLFDGRSPQLAISYALNPLFERTETTQENGVPIPDANWALLLSSRLTNTLARVTKRAVGFNDHLNKKYHLYIPAEVGGPSGQKYVYTPSSKYLVFDYDPANLFWTEYTFYNRYRSDYNQDTLGRNANPAAGFTYFKNKLWFGGLLYRQTGAKINATLYRFNDDDSAYDYVEAGYPVYMDIHYNPITREQGSSTSFFKPLWIVLEKFVKLFMNDPVASYDEGEGPVTDFGNPFSIRVKGIKDYKAYINGPVATNAVRTIDPANGRTVARVKCTIDKARAYQIVVTNEDADPADLEVPVFDNIEFIYSTPYDKKTKETKDRG